MEDEEQEGGGQGDDNPPVADQPILGTGVVEQEGSQPTTHQQTHEEEMAAKRAQYPPPEGPPPSIPTSLTCPPNMNPTAVGILRGTMLAVSTWLLSGGAVIPHSSHFLPLCNALLLFLQATRRTPEYAPGPEGHPKCLQELVHCSR